MSQVSKNYFGYVYDKKVYDGSEFMQKFIDYLKEGKLYGTKCSKCGKMYLPPRERCQCNAGPESLEWFHQDDLTGKLATFTVVRFAPDLMVEKTGEDVYVLGIIEFSNGLRMMAQIRGLMSMPKVDMPVKLEFEELDQERITCKIKLA
ncbi:MAG: Zn-ribbon domain-containing OB-fold protein [Candidatus Hodarchaeales archaeon]